MSGIRNGWRGVVTAGLLFAGLVVVDSAGAAPYSRHNARDALLAEGCALDSTADDAERRLVRSLVQKAGGADELSVVTIDYPLDESIFPPDMIAPTFLWHDAALDADSWLVEIAFGSGSCRLHVLVPGLPQPEAEIDPEVISGTNAIYEPTPYQASARAWKPGPTLWDAVKAHSAVRPASVTFLGFRGEDPDRVLSRGRMRLTTSADPVGAPIFYRDVPLMPSPTKEGTIQPLPKAAMPLIAWRLRDVSRPASRVMLHDMPTCANCHSFSADGKTLGMDIDGPKGDKGAYAISPVEPNMVIENDEVITWNAFEDKPEGHKTLGFLSRMSPDGQFALTTLNESIYVVNFPDFRFGQVFYPTRGILAYYSRETGRMEALPGAADPEYVHCDAVWSPDGETIVFARAEAGDPYIKGRPLATYAGDPNERPIQYDLYRMPFNRGQGGRAEPIIGASNNGMSNTFPKVSPDGKWIVFVQCRNGQLMRPDGKLWIVPFAGGEPRMMRSNTRLMNSWHSFSPNGRWMVFSSKSNTPYTQMFLTHIDEAGNDSPALLIENSTAANRAVNLPEFVNTDYDEFLGIKVPAVDHYRHFHRANELAIAGQREAALVEYLKALAQEPDDSRILNNLAKTLLTLGRIEPALKHLRESLRINPYNVEMHTNLAYVLVETGEIEEARKHVEVALQVYPRYSRAWYNRATLNLRAGDYPAALDDYAEALRLRPSLAEAHTGRGMALRAMGELDAALAAFDTAIELDSETPAPWYFRALTRSDAGDLSGATDDLARAFEVSPADSPNLAEMESLRRRLREELKEGG